MSEQQNEWKVVTMKEWDAQTAEMAKLRCEIVALDVNSKFWFELAKKHAATIARLQNEREQIAGLPRTYPVFKQEINTLKELLAGARAGNAVLRDDNVLLLRERDDARLQANAKTLDAQSLRSQLGNALAELKQYKARNECATAALQGKEGQYQLQEIIPKPKPVLPEWPDGWSASYVGSHVGSWLDPVASGVRA